MVIVYNTKLFSYIIMAKLISMDVTMLLLLGVLVACLEITGAQSIGVCYGGNGNNLPSPSDVVALYKSTKILYKSTKIGRMRIYDTEPSLLQALKDSNIEVILSVSNEDLEKLANDAHAANSWVQNNVRYYFPSVKFRYIAVGDDVAPSNGDTQQYVPFLLRAIQNIYNAVMAAGLQTQIKVSTAMYGDIVDPSYPPSDGAFKGGDVQNFITPIVRYIASIGSPMLFNVYPYYAYRGDASSKLPYFLFTNRGPEFTDYKTGLAYQNKFDAIVDATYAALEKCGASNLTIVVSETGWPSAGGRGATVDNARTYNQNLINHVTNGTPKKPGAIETYIYTMFNENLNSPEIAKNFGLFYPSKQSVYPIDAPVVTYFTSVCNADK